MIICLEGLNGCGKTTIGTLLADKLNCSFLEHPNKATITGAACRDMVNLSPKKNNLVENKGSYLELLIDRALKDLTLSYDNTDKDKVYIWSRCQLSTLAYNYFCLPNDYPLNKKLILFQRIMALPQPDKLIFLDTPVKTCWQRTKARPDKSRRKSLRYLLNIKDNYEKSLDVAKTHGWQISKFYLKPNILDINQAVDAILFSIMNPVDQRKDP